MRIFRTVTVQLLFLFILFVSPVFASGISGAIFTTDSTCSGVDLNIYSNKSDVYINGGPSYPGAAGLPDGNYFVQVTEPNGTVLGKSMAANAVVTGGEFVSCYQLSINLKTVSSGFAAPGYDDTSNPGGEYKVWVSQDSTFPNNLSKTDNFKVKGEGGRPPQATLNVIKFYDANANGINDDEQEITGWKVIIEDGINLIRFTPVTVIVDPDDYTVTEFTPNETNWISTTPNPVNITLADSDNETVEFGNYCTVGSGGRTLGFWSNKNGLALLTAGDFAALTSLHLRKANGSDRDFSGTLAQNKTDFKNWILGAKATNMAYMLSAQLAAMKLNTRHGFVDGNAFYLPYGDTINALMAEAEAALGVDGFTPANDPNRSTQETLKNHLDQLNNGASIVPTEPCDFSFPEETE